MLSLGLSMDYHGLKRTFIVVYVLKIDENDLIEIKL